MNRLFRWIFSKELNALDAKMIEVQKSLDILDDRSNKINGILKNIDISVDVNEFSRSWAVISIQGQNTDYIKFIDLGNAQIREIQSFLRNFDKTKIDASPSTTKFIKCTRP